VVARDGWMGLRSLAAILSTPLSTAHTPYLGGCRNLLWQPAAGSHLLGVGYITLAWHWP